MAWDQQRRLRAARADDTIVMDPGAAPGGGTTPTPDHTPAEGRASSRWSAWGQRFGWLAALTIAVIALVFSVAAFANSGTSRPVGFNRPGHFAPYPGGGGGFGSGQGGNRGVAPNSGPGR